MMEVEGEEKEGWREERDLKIDVEGKRRKDGERGET